MNNVFELHHQIKQQIAFLRASITTDTTTPGLIIDTAGFTALEFIMLRYEFLCRRFYRNIRTW
jgi:hypothetical protein